MVGVIRWAVGMEVGMVGGMMRGVRMVWRDKGYLGLGLGLGLG